MEVIEMVTIANVGYIDSKFCFLSRTPTIGLAASTPTPTSAARNGHRTGNTENREG